ncbi:MAG: hypothetical protein HOC74_15920, partial [Gemmatimonadetes bacterium]|nr:hypothetical protein [Gemmatimonadota bacterium]
MTASEIALLSLGIAGSGFIVSLFTLYYSHLRPPILHTSVGPYIKIYHSDYHKGMGTSLYVPMSFYNRSNRASIVEKVGIELYRHAEPQKRYFMHWEAFAEYQIELGAWRWKEMAHSLPVLGKSSVQKTAWFCWSARNDERLVLLE